MLIKSLTIAEGATKKGKAGDKGQAGDRACSRHRRSRTTKGSNVSYSTTRTQGQHRFLKKGARRRESETQHVATWINEAMRRGEKQGLAQVTGTKRLRFRAWKKSATRFVHWSGGERDSHGLKESSGGRESLKSRARGDAELKNAQHKGARFQRRARGGREKNFLQRGMKGRRGKKKK